MNLLKSPFDPYLPKLYSADWILLPLPPINWEIPPKGNWGSFVKVSYAKVPGCGISEHNEQSIDICNLLK